MSDSQVQPTIWETPAAQLCGHTDTPISSQELIYHPGQAEAVKAQEMNDVQIGLDPAGAEAFPSVQSQQLMSQHWRTFSASLYRALVNIRMPSFDNTLVPVESEIY